jgi:membrane peptidoglycan carboxypeptidase
VGGQNVERHPDTTDAARRLFAALAADIARAASRLRPLSSASRIVVKSVLLGAMALVLVLALTMLWGLALRAADERPGMDGPSVLVETPNGETLGRVGPLSDTKRRADFPELLVKAVLSIEDSR